MTTFITSPWSYASTAIVPQDLIEVTTMGDKGRRFIEGLPVAYRDSLLMWACHYCGSMHNEGVHKCPNCGGERR